jgi:outer membrane protein
MNRKFSNGRSELRIIACSILLAGMLMPVSRLRAQQSPSTASRPPQLYQLSLKQAIDYASKNSISVKNALLDYEIQVQTNRGVTSQALPQVSATLNMTDFLQIPTTLIPGEFIGQPGTFIPVKFGTKWNNSAGVTLSQILFDGQVFVGLQARQTALDLAHKSAEITEQGVRVNVYKIYYQLLIGKWQMDQIDANIANQESLLHNSTEMFKNGFAEQLDVDKGTVQLANLQSEKVRLENTIANGYLGLKVLLGMPAQDSVQLTDSLSYDMIRDAALNDNYKYADRRDYQLLQINHQLNEFNIKRYKKEYIPTLKLNAAYSQNQYVNTFDLAAKNTWYPTAYVGLAVSIPIFDGFSKDANIQQAKIQLRETENSMDGLRISIDNQVKQAQLNFTAALATLDFQKKNMDLAQKVYDQTRKKYEQGLGSNQEITQALTDQRAAQANYFNALYSAVVARVDYINAVGKL